MGKVLPTLTLSGFIKDPNVIITKLFEYFITSDYSQSMSYYGNISSLKYLIRKHGSDYGELESDINNVLLKMYNRYFEDVVIETKIVEKKTEDNKTVGYVNVDITVTINDRTYTLLRAMVVADSKINSLDDSIDYIMETL